jgi:hypothetical protein
MHSKGADFRRKMGGEGEKLDDLSIIVPAFILLSHAEPVSTPHALSLRATGNSETGYRHAGYLSAGYLVDGVLKQVQHDLGGVFR